MSIFRAFSSWRHGARTSNSIPSTGRSRMGWTMGSWRTSQNLTSMPKREFPVASLPAPGRMHVDWEERVDFRRLHEYRLARTREAISKAGLGAILVFDMNNIRYITSTHIGQSAREKA